MFHDELWEGDYEKIQDIYVELPFKIDVFLSMAISRKDYPMDGNVTDDMIREVKEFLGGFSYEE